MNIPMRNARALPMPRRRLTIWRGKALPHAIREGIPDNVRHALDHELALIGKLDYSRPISSPSITSCDYARSQNILCQGRGSAANSAVCYCLGITDVDPRDGRLLFERFISSERGEPPDIDVDFEHERREEVIQHIYQHYGRDHTGIAATVISYRGRSAIREVGKAFGLSEDTIGALSSSIWGMGGAVREAELERAGIHLHSARIWKMRDPRARDSVVSASPVPACRRLRDHAQPARRSRADRQWRDGGPHLRRMGQGRSRCARHSQGRCARPWHADLRAQRVRTWRAPLWPVISHGRTRSSAKAIFYALDHSGGR